jgi:curli production assembly/transport component CsgE
MLLSPAVPFRCCCTAALVLLAAAAHAQGPAPPEPRLAQSPVEAPAPRIEIGGLVVDETLTRAGRDFYDAFFQRWRWPEGAATATLTVHEQPMPGLGSRLSIRVDGEAVFETQLHPRADAAATVEQAVHRVAQRLRPGSRRPFSPRIL